MDMFRDADSFMDVFSTGTYTMLVVLCLAMVVYFFFRMSSVRIPEGQRSGCTPVRYEEQLEENLGQ